MITDTITSTSYENDIFTINWQKSGSYKYIKRNGEWVNLKTNRRCNNKTSELIERYLK